MTPVLPRLAGALLTAAFLAMPLAGSALAGETCREDAIIVFDGSGSMSEMGFNQLDLPRIVEAREAMQRVISQVAPLRRLGLVFYGPGPEADLCRNVDLRFAPMRDAGARILAEIAALRPAGNTPLTEAVRLAARTLEGQQATVVLVTDGKETCNGRPCRLAAELAATAPGLVVHVIGFKVRSAHFNWDGGQFQGKNRRDTVARCLADRTGGRSFTTETVDELAQALSESLGCPVLSLRGPIPAMAGPG